MLIEYCSTGLELEVDASSYRQCSSRCQQFCENVYAVTIIILERSVPTVGVIHKQFIRIKRARFGLVV